MFKKLLSVFPFTVILFAQSGTTGHTPMYDLNGNLIDSGLAVTNIVQKTDTSLTSITTLGTITSGIWQGSVLQVPFGGTGHSSFNSHGVLITNGSNGFNNTSAGTTGQCLISNGVSSDPTFQNCAGGYTDPLTTRGDTIVRNNSGTTRLALGTSGYVLQSNGTDLVYGLITPSNLNPSNISGTGSKLMTGAGTFINGNLAIFDANSNIVDSGSTFSNFLVSTGTYSNPSWITSLAPSKVGNTVAQWNASQINGVTLSSLGSGIYKFNGSGIPSLATPNTDYVATNVTTLSSLSTVGTITSGTWTGSVIGVNYGGTGLTTATAHGVILGNGSSLFHVTSAGTSGQCFTSNGASSDPSFQTCASGFSDPTTTQGDFIYHGNSGTGRLALGAANTFLVSNGTDASWTALALSQFPGTILSGTGSKLQLTTGSKTNGDLASYDSSANIIDSGVIAANVIVSSGTYTNPSWISSLAASKVGNVTAQWNANQINGVTLSSLGSGIYKFNGSGVPSLATPNTDYLTSSVSSLSSLSTVGTITSGSWNGNTVGVFYGGTGNNSLTLHGLLVGNGSNAINTVGTGTSGQCLTSNGSGSDPSFQPCNIKVPFDTVTATNSTIHTASCVGDGVADDTQCIQFAINNAISNNYGRELYIGPGTYKITATLTMQNVIGFVFRGSGQQTNFSWQGQPFAVAFGTLSSINVSSNVATVTTPGPHSLLVGDVITVNGASPTTLNGTYTVASTPNTFQFTFSTGSGATATATVSGGSVTAINPTVAGTNYANPPTVVITPTGGDTITQTAAASAVLINGTVAQVVINTSGAGYVHVPTISFIGVANNSYANAGLNLQRTRMFYVGSSANATFENFKVTTAQAYGVASVISIFDFYNNNQGVVAPSQNMIKNVEFQGTNGGFYSAVRLLKDTTDQNNDFPRFDDVRVDNQLGAAFSLEGTQAHSVQFQNVSVYGDAYGQATIAGDYTGLNVGAQTSFEWINGFTGGNNNVDFWLSGTPQVLPYVIKGVSSEKSKQFLRATGTPAYCPPILIEGVRYATGTGASSAFVSGGNAIDVAWAGPFMIRNSTIGEDFSKAMYIKWTYQNVGFSGSPLPPYTGTIPYFGVENVEFKGSCTSLSCLINGNQGPTVATGSSLVTAFNSSYPLVINDNNQNHISTSGNYQVLPADNVVGVDTFSATGTVTVTLPRLDIFTANLPLIRAGYRFKVVDETNAAATHNIVVSVSTGESTPPTINGSGNYTISTNSGFVELMYTGRTISGAHAWVVVGK